MTEPTRCATLALLEVRWIPPRWRSAMVTAAPTRTDFTMLDAQIAHALFALRLARAVTARGRTSEDEDAERRAEANLNALLDFRHHRQR
jgi:hypothetical protein